MKINLTLDIQTCDGSSPLYHDIEREIKNSLNKEIFWYDTSLDRVLNAKIYIDNIEEVSFYNQ